MTPDTGEHGPDAPTRIHLEGVRARALDVGRNRLLVTGVAFAAAFLLILVRLVDLGAVAGTPSVAGAPKTAPTASVRADVVDRNGVVLATSLPVVSLFADPARVLNAEEAADQLSAVLPHLDRDRLYRRLSGDGRFVWLARTLTPRQQHAVNRLGLPGIGFQRAERRVYPHGGLAGHILGLTDIDGVGTAGVERRFDDRLRVDAEPLRLTLDLRVQTLVRDALARAVADFKAVGGAAVVMDVRTSDVVAMVSLPEIDPNQPESALSEAGFNRATKGVYEVGSVFKLLTAAMALDAGVVDLDDGYDASEPLRIARFAITDFHAKNRWLSVPEILVYSSNIGTAKMALDVGTERQQDYLRRFGLLDPVALELPEIGRPMAPSTWREINTMTISYGHGIAVSPLQISTAIAALVNGGVYRTPTLLADRETPAETRRVISETTSRTMRGLMNLVVERGTGRKAQVRGYRIGGKTGTADKLAPTGGYEHDKRISSFVGAFPITDPQFVVFAMIDEPVGNASTFNYATGGWVAAPVVGEIVRGLAPMYAIAPDIEHLLGVGRETRAARTEQERQDRLRDAIRRMAAEYRVDVE
jgi:cell division protein FtsI (penicillin-binding protein 3)